VKDYGEFMKDCSFLAFVKVKNAVQKTLLVNLFQAVMLVLKNSPLIWTIFI